MTHNHTHTHTLNTINVKFLVDKDGQVRRRYKPGDPLDQGLERDLLALLDNKPLPEKQRVYLGAA